MEPAVHNSMMIAGLSRQTAKKRTMFGWLFLNAIICASRSMTSSSCCLLLPNPCSMHFTATSAPFHHAEKTAPKDPQPSDPFTIRSPQQISCNSKCRPDGTLGSAPLLHKGGDDPDWPADL